MTSHKNALYIYFATRPSITYAMSGDIFVSYGREPEVLQFVTKLKHDLEENRFTVLVDIPPGSNRYGPYGDVGTVLYNCRALIAIVTNKYVNSPYCANELYTADRDDKKIYIVILEDINFGVSQAASGVQYVLSKTNSLGTTFMFRRGVDDYVTSLAKLIQGLKGMCRL